LASVEDVIFLSVVLFMFLIAGVTVWMSYDKVLVSFKSDQNLNVSHVYESMDAVQNKVANKFDYVIFIVMIGMILAMIIGGLFVDTHPVFAVVYFIVMVIALVFSAILAYAWSIIKVQPVFIDAVTHFPLSNFIVSNLPFFVLGAGFISMIIIYSKGRSL